MKKYLIILSLFFSISNCFCQSEKETIDFLNTKLSLYTQSFPMNSPAYRNIKTGFDENSNKIFIFDLFVDNEFFSSEKFQGKQINAVTLVRNGIGNLCIYLTSNDGLILNKFYGDEKETFKNEIRILLNVKDEEVYRIKKALEHLLKLNGAKLVDDNLFKN